MRRALWTRRIMAAAGISFLVLAAACNGILGNLPPGTGLGGETSSETGGAGTSGGATGSGGFGGSTTGGADGSGGMVILPEGTLAVSVTGLLGAVELEANGAAWTVTEDGPHELPIEVEVGDEVTLEVTDDPPGQVCRFAGDLEQSEQYTGDTFVFELSCLGDVASIASLTTDLGDLDFSSGTSEYTIDPPFVRYEGTFTATLTDPSATLRIDGDEVESGESVTIPLPTSLVTLQLEVVAESGRSQDYEVRIERQAEFEFVDYVQTSEVAMDSYGYAVAVDGEQFAVLAAGSVNLTDAAVYVYDFGSLAPVRTFDALDPRDYHAAHLAFSGGHVAVASGDYQSLALWSAGQWNSPSTSLDIVVDSGPLASADRLAVSLSGDTLAVGGFDTQRIYVANAEEWELEDEFNPFPSAGYGDPLFHALHGDTLVVGGDPASGVEGVTIFERSAGVWSEALVIERNVTGIAVGEGVVAVGVDDATDKIEIYEREGGTWAYQRQLFTSALPLAIHGPLIILGSGATAQVRLWTTDDFTDGHSLTRGDTTSDSDCTAFAASAALNEHGLVICDGCSECYVFR